MPDWSKLIREQLGRLDLPHLELEEIVTELAAHLEDVYEHKLSMGADQSDAMRFALNEISQQPQLAKKIKNAKQREEFMNARSKQFWLPALLSLTASMTLVMVLQMASTKLHMPWKHAGFAFLPYVLWVFLLPAIGAISGYLSMRAGAGRMARSMAVVFPSIVMSVLWIVLGMSLLIRKTPRPFQTLNFTFGFLLWVIVPGVALLIGTLPLSKVRDRMVNSIEG